MTTKKFSDLREGDEFYATKGMEEIGVDDLKEGDLCKIVEAYSYSCDSGVLHDFTVLDGEADKCAIYGFEENNCCNGAVRLYQRTETSNSEDIINEPSHYCVSGLPECIEIIRGLGLNFELGNAMKYLYRQGRKHKTDEDLRKAKRYIEMELERRENEQN